MDDTAVTSENVGQMFDSLIEAILIACQELDDLTGNSGSSRSSGPQQETSSDRNVHQVEYNLYCAEVWDNLINELRMLSAPSD